MRLALNTATIKRASLREAVDICAEAGIDGIGPWRDRVDEAGGARAAGAMIRDAGLTVTSLCRGGFFTSPGGVDDTKRAIDESAELGARELVLVCGGLPGGSRDLTAARQAVSAAIETLAPHARDSGVRLAIEPLHPMFCADRAVVSTLSQALDIAEQFEPGVVGVVVDTYHIWWEPDLTRQIARAGDRISTYQVCDWVVPLPTDMLLGRAHVGDGSIEFGPITAAVEAAGYRGHVEVEIFNQTIWDAPPRQTVATVVERYRSHILPSIQPRGSEDETRALT